MQTSQIHLIAAIAAATAAAGALAEESFYECVFSAKTSSLGYSSDTYSPFPASIVGSFHPTNNPGGTQTRPGLTGGSGNMPINCTASLAVAGDVPAQPSGGFRLILDRENLTVAIEDFTLDVFDGSPADFGTSVFLNTGLFRTFGPDTVFPGGIQPPIMIGPGQVSSLIISQASQTESAFLLEQDVGLYTFTMYLPADYALTATTLGQTMRAGEPLISVLPLYGTIEVGEGGELSVSFEMAHAESVQQALTISPFASFPIAVPTVQPPGQLANVLLSGGATHVQITMGLNGMLAASGSPEMREGDLNSDLSVDVVDLGIVIANWGIPGPTDLDANGTTDAMDLAIVLNNWS